MENQSSHNHEQEPQYVNCRASDIIKLLRTPTDRINICKELSKQY
jgi:hypothetical protein